LMMPAELVRVDALLDDVEKVRHYEGFVLMSPPQPSPETSGTRGQTRRATPHRSASEASSLDNTHAE
jgi:hypothetical protein